MSECDDEKEARRNIYGILTHGRTRKIGPVVRLGGLAPARPIIRAMSVRPTHRLIKVQRSQAIMRRSVFFFCSRIPFIPRHRFIYFLAILGMATFIDVERELFTDLLGTLATNGLVMGTWRKKVGCPDSHT